MSFYLVKTTCPDDKDSINFSFLTVIGVVFLFLFQFEVLSASHDELTEDKYDNDKALKFSQAAIDRTIDSYKFTNQDKQPIDITQYRGKPLIVSLIYTSCHHICPTLTNHLADVVKIAREA